MLVDAAVPHQWTVFLIFSRPMFLLTFVVYLVNHLLVDRDDVLLLLDSLLKLAYLFFSLLVGRSKHFYLDDGPFLCVFEINRDKVFVELVDLARYGWQEGGSRLLFFLVIFHKRVFEGTEGLVCLLLAQFLRQTNHHPQFLI